MTMNKKEFDVELALVKTAGADATGRFDALVTAGIELYWGDSNHNIQVINDLVDCAVVFKGLRQKSLVDYLNHVIPHPNLGAKGDNHFGRMDREENEKLQDTWDVFMLEHPTWHEFKVEANPVPFNIDTYATAIIKKLEKQMQDGKLSNTGLIRFKEMMNGVHVKVAEATGDATNNVSPAAAPTTNDSVGV